MEEEKTKMSYIEKVCSDLEELENQSEIEQERLINSLQQKRSSSNVSNVSDQSFKSKWLTEEKAKKKFKFSDIFSKWRTRTITLNIPATNPQTSK